MPKMLITGGCGFIGSHLCEKYVKEGHTVVCLDNFLSGNLWNIRHLLNYHNFKLVKGDIRDSALLDKLMPNTDVVLHLAAQVHVDRSYIEPRLTYDINVMGTQNILESARLHDVPRVVVTSTSEVYGSAQYSPIDENHPLDAPHPYGASKIAVDRMCHAYIQTYGMDIAIMRPFNVFGTRQRDFGYGGVISIFTRRVLSGIAPVIFGDGKQTRDYTYVDDTVRAFDAVINYKGQFPSPMNFGTGKEVSITDLANLIIKLSGKDLKPQYVEPRIGEVQRLIAHAGKAYSYLKWQPTVTLEDGLKKLIDWYSIYGFEDRLRIE